MSQRTQPSIRRPSLRRVGGRWLPAAVATAALAAGVPGALGTQPAKAHVPPKARAAQGPGGPAVVAERTRTTETVPRGSTAT